MMLKLYKRVPAGILYWEAWTDAGRVVIHEGRLGQRGKARYQRPPKGTTLKQFIARAAKERCAQGYKAIRTEDHHQVVAQYQLNGWGSARDLDKAIKIQGLFDECLGWTGNGHCDGNDIGDGSMNIFSDVVDPELGAKTLVAELRKHRLLAGAVVAVREGHDYRVVYPVRFEGQFSVYRRRTSRCSSRETFHENLQSAIGAAPVAAVQFLLKRFRRRLDTCR